MVRASGLADGAERFEQGRGAHVLVVLAVDHAQLFAQECDALADGWFSASEPLLCERYSGAEAVRVLVDFWDGEGVLGCRVSWVGGLVVVVVHALAPGVVRRTLGDEGTTVRVCATRCVEWR